MLSALVANIQDAVVLLDASGNVTFESPSASAILGVASDDVLGTFGLSRIHPDERAAVIESFERTRSTPGAVFRGTYRFQRGDGEWRHFEALARNLLDDPELAGVLITFRDVTGRIHAMEAAERAAAARDEFVSRMSHELRSPLHAIIGWSQLLAYDDRPEVREAAGHVVAAGSHLLRIVEDALDLAAVQEGRVAMEMRQTPIDDIVTEAVDLVLPLARRHGIRVTRIPAPPGEATAWADGDRLRQVLINLLSNGVKYNRPDGLVEIGWGPGGEARWRIFVRDTGPGIPESMFDRLFERFDRLGAEGSAVEGTGLGLAIARRLIELMGGAIGVESTPGRGSTFWVDVRAEVDEAASVRASSPGTSPPASVEAFPSRGPSPAPSATALVTPRCAG